MSHLVPSIVLTGGPCAGKTSAETFLLQKLPEIGVGCVVVPEFATLVFTHGVSPAVVMATPDRAFNFQRAMIEGIMAQEDAWDRIAAVLPYDKRVKICDRGIKDGEAYAGPKEYEAIMYDLGLTVADVNKRYRAVIHMVTAADGAEGFYTLANNAARTETAEQARDLDARTQAAWVGHQNVRVVGNIVATPTGDRALTFEEKLDKVLAEVCWAMGIPVPVRKEHKFVLGETPVNVPVPHILSFIEQTYLQAPAGVERRLRKISTVSGATSGAIYVYTEKRDVTPGNRVTTERILTAREYIGLLADRDSQRRIIQKTRTAFVWKNQYFKMDVFQAPIGRSLLEIETTDAQPFVVFPPFLKVEAEVTGDPAFKNADLALRFSV